MGEGQILGIVVLNSARGNNVLRLKSYFDVSRRREGAGTSGCYLMANSGSVRPGLEILSNGYEKGGVSVLPGVRQSYI